MFLGTLKGLYSRALNYKKPVTVFRVKKVESFLLWIALPKIQKRVMTSRYIQPMCRYSPCRHRTCNDSWYSATKFLKFSFCFLSLLSLAAHGRSNSTPVGTATEAAGGVFVHELYPFIKYIITNFVLVGLLPLWIFVSAIHFKKTPPFLALNVVTGFLKFQATGPCKYTGDCVGTQGLSIDTMHSWPLLS